MADNTNNLNEEDALRQAAEIVGGVYDEEYRMQQVYLAQCIMHVHLMNMAEAGLCNVPAGYVPTPQDAIEFVTGGTYDSATTFPEGFDPDFFEMVCAD